MIVCNNCETGFEGNFCPNCGQRPNSGRIVLKESVREVLEHYFDLDAPFFKTVKDLFIRPGELARNYIHGQRKPYAHPIRYFILILALYLLVKALLGFNPVQTFGEAVGSADYNPDAPDTRASNFFSEHINTFLFLFVCTLGIFSKLFFIRSKYHFAEHLTLSFYIVSQYIFISLFVILLSQVSSRIFFVNYLVVLIYPTYVLMSFHEGFWAWRLIKSLLAVILAWAIYAISGFLLSRIIVEVFNV